MKRQIFIRDREISKEAPVYMIAEMSANHLGDKERAKEIIRGAKEAGADAIKLQTYTADTITIDCDMERFRIMNEGSLWNGETYHHLYERAYMPWEWQEELREYAESIGITCFSAPFDLTAVDFLERIQMPAHKIASYEITDIPLIRACAKTGKPVLISTGIARLEDIELAVNTCLEEGNEQVILLKCTSAYPSPYEDMNIRVIPNLADTFDCLTGISDHTMGSEVTLGAVALGARVVEKHVTLKRADGGADGDFSMELEEFADMVRQIRNLEKALGRVTYRLTAKQERERESSRSLSVVADIRAGETFTAENMRSIRPGGGLHTKYYEDILGRQASRDIKKGEPMDWSMVR